MSKNLPAFPSVLPGGALMPHMSARQRTQVIDALFEATGGFEKAQAWIEKSDDNYAEFFKIWAKGAQRATSVEVSANGDLADIIKRLDEEDRMKAATVIEGTVTDAVEKERV